MREQSAGTIAGTQSGNGNLFMYIIKRRNKNYVYILVRKQLFS